MVRASAGEPLNSSGGPSHGQPIDGESGADAKHTCVWLAAIPERYRHCDFLLQAQQKQPEHQPEESFHPSAIYRPLNANK